MAKLPAPPAPGALQKITADIQVVPRGTCLWRIYSRGGPYPFEWDTFRPYGPLGSRFDHHLPPPRRQRRRILYGALDGPTCFAEVFQQARIIDRNTREPWLVSFSLDQELTLLDLTGSWPTRAGASQAISTGPRSRARLWSRAIYEAYPELRGIYYPSSMSGRPAVALYERASGALPLVPAVHVPLSDPRMESMLEKIAEDFGYGML